MNNFRINLTNELTKLFSRKKTFVLLGFTAAVPMIAAAAAAFFQGGLGIAPLRGEDFPVYMLGLLIKLLLPLFIFMAAADIFAGELKDQSIKSIMLRPIERYKIYFSKLACIGVLILMLLGVLFVSSLISGLFVGISSSNSFAASAVTGLLQYLAAFLPLLLLGMMSSFISLLTKGSSSALVMSLLVFIVLSAVSVVLPSVSKLLPTSYTGWYMLFSSVQLSAAGILNTFMFIISYSIIFLTSGYLLFDRKEL